MMTLTIVCDHCQERTEKSYIAALNNGVMEGLVTESVRLPAERSPHGRRPAIELQLGAVLPSMSSLGGQGSPSHLCRDCLMAAFRMWAGPAETEPASQGAE